MANHGAPVPATAVPQKQIQISTELTIQGSIKIESDREYLSALEAPAPFSHRIWLLLQMSSAGKGPSGPPPVVKKVLSLFGSGREEVRVALRPTYCLHPCPGGLLADTSSCCPAGLTAAYLCILLPWFPPHLLCRSYCARAQGSPALVELVITCKQVRSGL